jgi:hypothetical protein
MTDMNATEIALVKRLSEIYFAKMPEFINKSLPGLLITDIVETMVLLMTSKNPDQLVRALVSSDGLFARLPKNLMGLKLPPTATKTIRIFELMLNSTANQVNNIKATQYLKMMKNNFLKLDKTAGQPALFSSIWYSTLPCFDVKGLTSEEEGQQSILRSCQWKGVEIPCAAIFTTFPTDRGMCCAFNMKAADEIFEGKMYSNLIKGLQNYDQSHSSGNSIIPDWYTNADEPKTQAGINKGLTIMLDAHSNIWSSASVDSDFEGFTGLIDRIGSYPLMLQNGFQIKTGHNNMIALSATEIDAADDLRSISPINRNCLFADETGNLKLYKSYSKSNCLLECSLNYAQNKLTKKLNMTTPCTPWYFPFKDGSVTLCDPWQAIQFYEFMFNDIPDDVCSDCLPDCVNTIYHPVITSLPFKTCDESNLGISRFCNLDDTTLPLPKIWGKQVKEELTGSNNTILAKQVESSERIYARSTIHFTQLDTRYNAYEKDIAVLQIFFDKPSVFQFVSQPSQTWIGFFSAIGGLLGLCLGISLITFIELVWLCLRLGAKAVEANFEKSK